jgi:hypothetical protein
MVLIDHWSAAVFKNIIGIIAAGEPSGHGIQRIAGFLVIINFFAK